MTTNYISIRVFYLLDVDLNVFLQVVFVQVEHEVVDKVKAIADDDERQLVSQSSFLRKKNVACPKYTDERFSEENLQEILDSIWVIAVAFTANSLHFLHLACLASSLNVFEVNVGLLAEIHDGAQEIKQSYKASKMKNQFQGKIEFPEPSKDLNDSKSSIRAVVVNCS